MSNSNFDLISRIAGLDFCADTGLLAKMVRAKMVAKITTRAPVKCVDRNMMSVNGKWKGIRNDNFDSNSSANTEMLA